MTTPWANRIVGYGSEAPDQLVANPKNWRLHPKHQQAALKGALDELGWIQNVIVNQRTGFVVDGHARVTLALRHDQPEVPVTYVDLGEDEEALALATLDPIGALAGADHDKLEALLADVNTGEAALQEMLSELAANSGIVPADDWASALGALPDGDKSPFEQMTFTLSTRQAGIVRDALKAAKDRNDFHDTGNENSNGNALAAICEAYDA